VTRLANEELIIANQENPLYSLQIRHHQRQRKWQHIW